MTVGYTLGSIIMEEQIKTSASVILAAILVPLGALSSQ